MQILRKFCHNKQLTRWVAPHMINTTAADRQLGKKSYVNLLQIVHLLQNERCNKGENT